MGWVPQLHPSRSFFVSIPHFLSGLFQSNNNAVWFLTTLVTSQSHISYQVYFNRAKLAIWRGVARQGLNPTFPIRSISIDKFVRAPENPKDCLNPTFPIRSISITVNVWPWTGLARKSLNPTFPIRSISISWDRKWCTCCKLLCLNPTFPIRSISMSQQQ